jgi:hypothetical protein
MKGNGDLPIRMVDPAADFDSPENALTRHRHGTERSHGDAPYGAVMVLDTPRASFLFPLNPGGIATCRDGSTESLAPNVTLPIPFPLHFWILSEVRMLYVGRERHYYNTSY